MIGAFARFCLIITKDMS